MSPWTSFVFAVICFAMGGDAVSQGATVIGGSLLVYGGMFLMGWLVGLGDKEN